MAKWRLFGKTKEEEIVETPEKDTIETEIVEETVEEDKPLAEYKETLQTGKATTKTTTGADTDQRVWRDVNKIEKNVDTIDIKKAEKSSTNVEKTVDELIKKRKKKD